MSGFEAWKSVLKREAALQSDDSGLLPVNALAKFSGSARHQLCSSSGTATKPTLCGQGPSFGCSLANSAVALLNSAFSKRLLPTLQIAPPHALAGFFPRLKRGLSRAFSKESRHEGFEHQNQ